MRSSWCCGYWKGQICKEITPVFRAEKVWGGVRQLALLPWSSCSSGPAPLPLLLLGGKRPLPIGPHPPTIEAGGDGVEVILAE